MSLDIKTKKLAPYVIALIIMILVNVAYFFPQLQGKAIPQVDILSGQESVKAVKQYEEANNKTYLWNPAPFGGMPLLANPPSSNNLIYKFYNLLKIGFDEPIGLYLAGTLISFIMFLVLGFNPWYSLIFSVPMVLATDNVILWEAGHNSKIRTLIFTPFIIAGILSVFEKQRYLLGGILLTLGFAFGTQTRHPQMTYYVLLVFMIYGLIILIQTIKSKNWIQFAKGTGVVLAAIIIGMSTSATKIWSMYDYSESTMRGKAILQSASTEAATSSEVDGLEWTYAMQWSNDVKDVMASFIPGFVGGSNGEKVSRKSQSYKTYRTERAPLYWGGLPITSGPNYLGASVFFLFLLGLFAVKGNVKWWLGLGYFWMILLSMGDNFSILNRFIFDYLPFYSKFRAPSSVLNVASFFVPILGAYGLKQFLQSKKSKKKKKNSMVDARKKRHLLIVSGLTILLPTALAFFGPSILDFSAPNDAYYTQQGADITPYIQDRKSLFVRDCWRTAFIGLLVGSILFLFLKNKITELVVIAAVGSIMLFDIWGVNTRYVDHDDFQSKRQIATTFNERPVDTQILSLEKERHNYRVFDITSRSPFSSSTGSVHHNLINGYLSLIHI